MVGLVTFATLAHALVAPLLFLALATLGRTLYYAEHHGQAIDAQSAHRIPVAWCFWTWLWGPVGAFLAVPLLIVALVVIGHLFPENEPELPT